MLSSIEHRASSIERGRAGSDDDHADERAPLPDVTLGSRMVYERESP
jgi:hypothetical protein